MKSPVRVAVTGAAGQIEDKAGLARDLERPAHQAPFAPQRQPAHKALRLCLLANLRMLAVITLGELMLNRGGRWLRRHGPRTLVFDDDRHRD